MSVTVRRPYSRVRDGCRLQLDGLIAGRVSVTVRRPYSGVRDGCRLQLDGLIAGCRTGVGYS